MKQEEAFVKMMAESAAKSASALEARRAELKVSFVEELAASEAVHVGASGGSLESSEDWQRRWASGIRERSAASKSRRQGGRAWVGRVMSSKVKRDRAAKRDILQKAQERLAVIQRVAESTRRSRARDWLGAHVVRDRA